MTESPFRFIVSGAGSASFNMALDEALFLLAGRPVLRFYRWDKLSVSMGRFQDPSALSRERVLRSGYPAVRRPTGGGWILHGDELTYSVVAPLSADGVKAAYRKLTRFLGCFYRDLGLDAGYACELSGYREIRRTEICYAGNEPYDILVGGRKIGGNAQRVDRRRAVVLQHGSIPLRVKPELLGVISETKSELEHFGAAGLRELGIVEPEDVLERRLEKAFRETQGMLESPSEPTEAERKLAANLIEEKYGREEWIWRKP
jgi:lipoate-protein ligase A